jgi:hypothetical protein
VLKKAGFVASTAIGLMLVGGTAFAAPAATAAPAPSGDDFSFTDAFNQFNEGGGALGYGAASLVSGAYAGIATTPALILHSLHHH